MGVAEKSYCPKIYACAESAGFVRAARSKFSVMFACGMSRSHSDSGKFGSVVASPALK